MTDAQLRAQAKYKKKTYTSRALRLNINKDQDLIERINLKGFSKYVKNLIREDIKKDKRGHD